jgi:hypothetical protein
VARSEGFEPRPPDSWLEGNGRKPRISSPAFAVPRVPMGSFRFARYSAQKFATPSRGLSRGSSGDLDGAHPSAVGRAAMTSNRYQDKRRKLLRGQRALHERAPTKPGHGMEMPRRPPGLDPIVAKIIEALARTIIRDEDRRASSPPMDKKR